MGAGGGANESQNESHSESYVFRGQEPYLLDLYGQSQALSRSQDDAGQIAYGILEPFVNENAQAVHNIGSSGDYASGVLDGSDQGMQTLLGLQSQDANPYLDSMFNSAARQVNNNLERNILPSINDGGQQANPYGGGGSRQGIAEGLALSDANQQMTDMAANLYGGAYSEDQGIRLGAASNYINSGLSATGAQAGIAQALQSGTQGLVNLGLTPYQSQWSPLQNYAQVVNSPVVLNNSSGTGSSSGWNFTI